MPLPDDIHDTTKTYRLRVCIRFQDNPVAGMVTPGSTLHPCDRCAELIWVHDQQVIPEVEGMTIDGDFNVCLRCLAELEAADGKPIEMIGPVPDGFTLDGLG